jgi:hypothetical protein
MTEYKVCVLRRPLDRENVSTIMDEAYYQREIERLLDRICEDDALIVKMETERDALKAEVERLQSVNELMCAQIDSLPPPEPDLLKRQLRKVADKRARAALQESTDD